MIAEKLRSILESDTTTLLKTNDLYGFEIHSVKPRQREFQLLFTDGMARYRQPASEKFGGFEHIELYMCLPDYWDLSKKSWPVDWLNRIAEVPQKNKTWFGPGDTLPAGKPPVAVDDKLNAPYFILSPPLLLATEMEALRAGESAPQLMAVIPIFRKEFDFKMQNSGTILFEKFRDRNVTELIDIFREPVARKKFMGIF